MMMEPPARQEILATFKAYVTDLGYKRVLIVGAAASGVYDTEQREDDNSAKDTTN